MPPGIPSLSQAPASQRVHVVSRGETLYAIAWKNGMDYRQVARLNNIPPPYVIYPGQRLTLSDKPAPRPPAQRPTPSPNASRYKNPPNHAKPVQEKVAIKTANGVNVSWVWPTRGNVLSRFSSAGTVNKGIDLAGKKGDPVYAAADGTIVYSGPGITGYGNLVIVKHNEVFLSAYAHNSRLLLSEGTPVKAGQKIAEVGSSGTNREKLHFEIRRHGVPVDPLRYLPKR